jgi:hypothetical protein
MQIVYKLLLQGFLIPIINTIFIELSMTAYQMISFSPRLILRFNLLDPCARVTQIKSSPNPVTYV